MRYVFIILVSILIIISSSNSFSKPIPDEQISNILNNESISFYSQRIEACPYFLNKKNFLGSWKKIPSSSNCMPGNGSIFRNDKNEYNVGMHPIRIGDDDELGDK